jgi:hypothetical protein
MSDTDYGVFANIVAIGGSLASAAAAFQLAFQKRAKWQPPEEAVPAGTSRVAGLVAMVFVALIYVFGARIGDVRMGIITVVLLVFAIVSLLVAIRTNIENSYYYPDRTEASRKLGGTVLTDESARILKEQQGMTAQQLFADSQGEKDRVWTKASQANVNVKSTLSFIGLIGFGTCALAAAAGLVALAVN